MFPVELSQRLQGIQNIVHQNVTWVVSVKAFVIDHRILRARPQSLLCKLIAVEISPFQREKKTVFIDRTGVCTDRWVFLENLIELRYEHGVCFQQSYTSGLAKKICQTKFTTKKEKSYNLIGSSSS